jgi:hypothetical protein
MFLRAICGLLDIPTRITRSSDYEPAGDKSERLPGICRQAGADVYLSGPSARGYLDEGRFAGAGIAVRYMDYSGYPEHPQMFPPFVHAVSVLDLLFNAGPEARRYMKCPLPAAPPAAANIPTGTGRPPT